MVSGGALGDGAAEGSPPALAEGLVFAEVGDGVDEHATPISSTPTITRARGIHMAVFAAGSLDGAAARRTG